MDLDPNETYWKRKIATRKKLCKLLDKYRLYLVENCGTGLETSRLVDCIEQVDTNLKWEMSLFERRGKKT